MIVDSDSERTPSNVVVLRTRRHRHRHRHRQRSVMASLRGAREHHDACVHLVGGQTSPSAALLGSAFGATPPKMRAWFRAQELAGLHVREPAVPLASVPSRGRARRRRSWCVAGERRGDARRWRRDFTRALGEAFAVDVFFSRLLRFVSGGRSFGDRVDDDDEPNLKLEAADEKRDFGVEGSSVGSTSERTWRSEVTVLVVLVWTLSSVLSDPASCGCECRSWTRRGVGRPPEVVRYCKLLSFTHNNITLIQCISRIEGIWAGKEAFVGVAGTRPRTT